MDQQFDRQRSSSVWDTFSHQSFGSTEWSQPNSIIHANIKPEWVNKSIQTRKSRVVVINSKQRQTSGRLPISINRVSRCGLILPHNYNYINGNNDKNMTKNERIIAWINEVNQAYAKHHYYGKKSKINCTCTRRCAVICIVCSLILFLIAIILTILLIIFLMKPKSTVPTEAVLRWNQSSITIAGLTATPGLTSDRLFEPWDVVVDWSNNLFVSDRGNHRIQKFLRGSTNGITLIGNGTCDHSLNSLCTPNALCVDVNENIYVADRDNQRVQFWSKSTTSGTTILGDISTNISLFNPYGLNCNPDTGFIYITDRGNHRILSYRFDNSLTNVVGGNNGPGFDTTQLYHPHASFYDIISKSLLVANSNMNTIVRYKIGVNRWTLVIGDMNGLSGNTSMLLNYPTAVKVDPMGNIYVADRYNNRIQLFMNGKSNHSITIAGSGTLLNGPTSFAFDGQLNLYVVDQYNHRIQKFIRY